jgi:hypothetical protein
MYENIKIKIVELEDDYLNQNNVSQLMGNVKHHTDMV